MGIRKAFRSTCRTLFGREIGELEEYTDYLREPLVGKFADSHFSTRKVFLTSTEYCKGARFFDHAREREQVAALSKPININDVKDIDSLFDSVKEKVFYSGNKVTGKSMFVGESDNVIDSLYILNSSVVDSCKYNAYSYEMARTDFAFGTTSTGDSSSTIRCFYNVYLKRAFESAFTNSSSDCYFCYNVCNSSNCMFAFNVRSKRNMIGNIQLEPARYSELKSKLLTEIADELEQKKRLDFSIVNIHSKVTGK